jgi:CRISPR/Cas system-associated exonuclease Cas4 (RecB family)
VRKEHIAQGVTYFISFGIPDVLYLYENRDTLDKKAFMLSVTEEQVNEVLSTMAFVNRCVKKNIVPDKEEDKHKCSYCLYKEKCNSI